jgi:flavin-dependent dehydrogenase
MSAPVLIAGGGLAGGAAAALLAQGGLPVTLVERSAGPADKVCGEFLSAEAIVSLQRLGLDVAALGGETITHVRLVRGEQSVATALPFTGLGLSRRVLDEALLRHAAACGARVLRGHAVQGVEIGAGHVALNVDGLGPLRGERLLLATGKHELRGLPREAAPVNGLVGLKMYFRLGASARAALAGHVELIPFPGGYAGLQLVEGGRANLCLVVQKVRLAESGGWNGLLRWLCGLCPHLGRSLAGAEPLLPAPLTIARVPYGFLHDQGGPEEVMRLGDQAGVIASFTGDGMAIALHSAARAAAAIGQGQGAAAYHRQLARDLAGQIGRAGLLSRVAARPAAQRLLFAGARLWPGGLAVAARMTRVSEAARINPG